MPARQPRRREPHRVSRGWFLSAAFREFHSPFVLIDVLHKNYPRAPPTTHQFVNPKENLYSKFEDERELREWAGPPSARPADRTTAASRPVACAAIRRPWRTTGGSRPGRDDRSDQGGRPVRAGARRRAHRVRRAEHPR